VCLPQHKICQEAARLKVRLMVDAEQTYFQPAIDAMVLHMQQEYNIGGPFIMNTYQCYLKNSLTRLTNDIEVARREKYYFGAKIVRGAYMVAERSRAKQFGYPSPIHEKIADTHACYDAAIEQVVHQVATRGANLMVATHNEQSITRTVDAMRREGLQPSDDVYFGQLLGMADHLTFTLGQNGYKAYKYVPYGPVHEVVPYLLRRAQENSMLVTGKGAKREQQMLFAELKRRIFQR
jgi:proline dehydrogenase